MGVFDKYPWDCNCNSGMDFWSSGDIPKTGLEDFHIPSPTLENMHAALF